MKSSTIAVILATTAGTIAAPYTKTARNIYARDALSDCSSNANPTACQTVVNAINGWISSVDAVNNFLNTADGITDSNTLLVAEQLALNAAMLEPGFLKTLSATTGLGSAGTDAANTLGMVFGTIPMTLMQLQQSQIFVSDGVNTINNVRCPQVLPNIGDLWIDAALAVGADPPPVPQGPNACPVVNV